MHKIFLASCISKSYYSYMDAAHGRGGNERGKEMKTKSSHQQNVEFIMAACKVNSAFARRALRATKGQHWTAAVRYIRDEIATHSIPTGPDFTADDLAKAWS